MKVRTLKAARADLRQAARYYDEQRPGLGGEFRDEVRAAIERIKNFPASCPRIDDEIRQCRTSRFPYGIIFRIKAQEILIVSITHLHRNPGHWRDRLGPNR